MHIGNNVHHLANLKVFIMLFMSVVVDSMFLVACEDVDIYVP
jgi:hypothetical protein